MSLKKFLVSRAFFTNLIIAFVLVAGLLFVTLQGLKSYTRHGQANPVPNFAGMNKVEAAEVAVQFKMEVVVIDSVHVKDAPPGIVVEQIPEAGFKVKDNRTIFLTINSSQPEQVTLPKLTDISFRQAQVLIENCGLTIGEISYQPSEYKNLVLQIQQNSVEIFQGALVIKGSPIDFVIGRDQGNEKTTLPDLIGLQIENAKNTLTNAMLNSGVLIYDKTILTAEDSINALVWKQYPSQKGTSVNMGTSVDLWITVDSLKIHQPTNQDF